MRRLLLVCAVLVVASGAVAQESTGITYGDFAVLVVDTVSPSHAAAEDPQTALDLLKGYGFMPLGWRADGVLTQSDLAGVLAPTGAIYQAVNPEAPLTRTEAVGVVRSQQGPLSEYFTDLAQEDCSHGQFAVLLARTISPPQEQVPDGETALDLLKRAGLVPLGWLVPEILNHGELADVMARMGVIYETVSRDDPVSVPFVVTLLRRELSMVRDYWARRVGHGFSTSHVLDQGVDRAVSPSAFYYRAHRHPSVTP